MRVVSWTRHLVPYILFKRTQQFSLVRTVFEVRESAVYTSGEPTQNTWSHLRCLWEHSNKGSEASFHRLPSDPVRRGSWLAAFGLESQLKAQPRVCCRQFRDGNDKNEPIVSLGKRFASPVKRQNSRAKRAKTRESMREYSDLRMKLENENESSSSSVTPSYGASP